MQPIADLHCDLLSYLVSSPTASADDPTSRCSLPQMRAGGVLMQGLAIYAPTQSDSVGKGERQVKAFLRLLQTYLTETQQLSSAQDWELLENSGRIGLIPAIENASVFCGEDEAIQAGLERFRHWNDKIGPMAYVGLTWNEENRFGGGADSKVGLKEDGKRLLAVMDGQKIPVDLSHCSDYLAYALVEFIDAQGLDIPILASHSNARAVCLAPRNLPSDLIDELIRRGGLIGLNFFRPFVGGSTYSSLCSHVEKVLELGGSQHICFGADFFHGEAVPPGKRKEYGTEPFFSGAENSTCYQRVLKDIEVHLGLTNEEVRNLSFGNIRRFYEVLWG